MSTEAADCQEVDNNVIQIVENHFRTESTSTDSDEQGKTTEKLKVDILLKPTGNAPIMKKKKWTVESDKKIGWVVEFIKKYLKLEANEKLFVYVNQTFAPSPDQIIKNLYDCYNTEGKLVLHYCKTQAWG